MPKRLTCCDVWNEDWFLDLSKDGKIFFQFLLDRSTVGGIWKVNLRTASLLSGADCKKEDVENLVFDLQDGRWFIPIKVFWAWDDLLKDSTRKRRPASELNEEGLWEMYYSMREDVSNFHNVNDDMYFHFVGKRGQTCEGVAKRGQLCENTRTKTKIKTKIKTEIKTKTEINKEKESKEKEKAGAKAPKRVFPDKSNFFEMVPVPTWLDEPDLKAAFGAGLEARRKRHPREPMPVGTLKAAYNRLEAPNKPTVMFKLLVWIVNGWKQPVADVKPTKSNLSDVKSGADYEGYAGWLEYTLSHLSEIEGHGFNSQKKSRYAKREAATEQELADGWKNPPPLEKDEEFF